MRKYKAYEFTLRQYESGSYSVHWGIRDPDTCYHYHRVGGPACARYSPNGTVGGPAYVRYNPDGTVLYATWDLEGREYATEAEYQKALEKWLNE